VESLILKYLHNAIVAFFFTFWLASSQQKINIFWIFFFSGVRTNSVSFWSFLLGQTQVDLEGGQGKWGLSKKSLVVTFPCVTEVAKPYPQNNLPILLGWMYKLMTKSNQGILMLKSFVNCCPLTRILIFTFSFKNFHVNISFRASKTSNSIWQHLFKIVEPNSTFAILSSFAWFWLNFLYIKKAMRMWNFNLMIHFSLHILEQKFN
jgi:hypothetical protein